MYNKIYRATWHNTHTTPGIPLAVVGCWCSVMWLQHTQHCWRNYSRLPFIWILEAPMLLALLVSGGVVWCGVVLCGV